MQMFGIAILMIYGAIGVAVGVTWPIWIWALYQ